MVSFIGAFRISMQENGKLVLYAKTAGDAWSPYWDTGTWSLPATERPTLLVLNERAELQLLDGSGAKRACLREPKLLKKSLRLLVSILHRRTTSLLP